MIRPVTLQTKGCHCKCFLWNSTKPLRIAFYCVSSGDFFYKRSACFVLCCTKVIVCLWEPFSTFGYVIALKMFYNNWLAPKSVSRNFLNFQNCDSLKNMLINASASKLYSTCGSNFQNSLLKELFFQ